MKTTKDIDWAEILGYPEMSDDISFEDFVYERLTEKVCPIHKTPMYLYKNLKLHDDYTRNKYLCHISGCRCVAHFVGDELKSNSVGMTAEYIWRVVKDRCKKQVIRQGAAFPRTGNDDIEIV